MHVLPTGQVPLSVADPHLHVLLPVKHTFVRLKRSCNVLKLAVGTRIVLGCHLFLDCGH